MPVSPDAIERYLRHRLPAAPPVKELSDTDLYRIFERKMGFPYRPATQPRRQQLAAAAFLAAQNNALLFFGMRTGKTKIILDRFNHLRQAGAVRKGLVIVPNPVIRPVWINECVTHTPHLKVRTVANDPMDFVDAAEDPAADIVVVSWSSLQNIFCYKKTPGKNAKDKKNYMEIDVPAVTLAASLFDFGAIDEIHGAKDKSSLRFNIAEMLLAQTHSRIGCTGTPFGRDPFALWSQAFLVDRGACLGYSYHFFQHAFGVTKYNHFSTSKTTLVYDEKKDDIFRHKTQPLALSYTMRECGIQQYAPNVVRLEMTPEQKKHYNQAVTEYMQAERGTTARANTFVRTRMISSGYVPYTDEMGARRYAPLHGTPKLCWLEDLIEQAGDAKVVVFHEYKYSGQLITALLDKKKIKHSWLYGEAPDKIGAVEKFKQGKVDWFVVNNESGNAGIDLRAADMQVFFESPTSPIIRQQAEARALGERQGRGLVIDDLVCSKVELRLLSFHREGLDMLSSLVYSDEDLREA